MVALELGEVNVGTGKVTGVPVWVYCAMRLMLAAGMLLNDAAGQGYEEDMPALMMLAPTPPVIQGDE